MPSLHEKKTLSRVAPWAFLAAFAVGCSDDDSSCPPPPDPPPPPPPATHPDVVLRDVYGDPIASGSSVVYSPRTTCGRCHDVDTIANGYHFSQGRTDTSGKIDERLGKPWTQEVTVLSPGMFGKW